MIEDRVRKTIASVGRTDGGAALAAQALLDDKTKPRRSLGRLEDLACQVAGIRGIPAPPLPDKAIVVMCADHGVAAEGVSAYPSEVTRQMLLNFATGGAAINVLARHAGARVVVVDMGVVEALPPTVGILPARIGPGTRSFVREAAMTREQALTAIDVGIRASEELTDAAVELIGLGDMGIGNTTSSSALVAAYLGARVKDVAGRGTGIDEEGLGRKIATIERGLTLHGLGGGAGAKRDPIDVLACVGGFEIAGLAGVAIGAAARRVPVVLDGFIASTAGLVAARICPAVASYLIASHRSVEVGHRIVLEALGLVPLLDLEMRLGEGTGAALAMTLIEAALRILHEMATFSSAGVSDTGR